MPLVAPDMPRQMLPPPTTTAISTLSSTRASATSSAIRCTSAASMPKFVVVSANASPDSLRMTRRYSLSAISRLRARSCRRTLVLAHLHAGEPRELGVAAEPLDQFADADLGVLHRRLLEQYGVLVEGVEPALHGTLELGLGNALVAALLLDDGLLAREHIGRDLVARQGRGRREGDVQGDLVRDVARLLARRVDAGDLDQHRDGAAFVLVVPVGVEEAVGLEAHDTPEHDVLAQLPGQLRERFAPGGAAERERRDVAVAVGRDQLRELGEHRGEVAALGDEVGVAVELDDRADVPVDHHVDRAFGGLAVTELARLGEPLGAEEVEGALGVARGLLERGLAVHHPCARRLAERSDVLGRVLSHSCRSPGSRWCPRRRRARARWR